MKNPITPEQIADAFIGTSFGSRNHITLLQQGVLKVQAGYKSGSTLTIIMEELGLIGTTGKIVKKGRRFLYESFKNEAWFG